MRRHVTCLNDRNLSVSSGMCIFMHNLDIVNICFILYNTTCLHSLLNI